MSVRRRSAAINEALELRVHFRTDGTGDVFDPFEISKVEILDSDMSTVLETITVITKISTGYYKVVTASSWNTVARKVYDRWTYKISDGCDDSQSHEHANIAESVPVVCTKTGYSFDNYNVPAGEWGVPGTADDLRYTFLYGVNLVAQNDQEVADSQLEYMIRLAVGKIETLLGIDIRKRIYKTKPADHEDAPLTRGRKVQSGVDYTDEEDSYPFRPMTWRNYGFMPLRHYPVLSIERAILYTVTHASLADLKELGWLRFKKESGHVYVYPQRDTFVYGPPSMAAGASWLWLRNVSQQYPQGFEFDYTTGYLNSDYIPQDLREVIMKVAAIGALQWVGDGLLAGFSSSSISLDGLSESFSSTQSATSAFFGARILSYQNEVKEFLKRNRYKFSNVPLAFT